MKSILTTLILFLLFAITIQAQPIYFKWTYGGEGIDWAGSPLSLSDDTILVNSFYGGLTDQGVSLMSINFSGQLVASTEFEKPGYTYGSLSEGSLIRSGNNFYVGGSVQWTDTNDTLHKYSYPFIAKYNLNRDTIWVKHMVFDTNSYTVVAFRETSDSNFVISGTVSTANPGLGDFYLMKIDTSGNLLWKKTYGADSVSEIDLGLEELPDSSFVLSGMQHYSGSFPDLNYRPWIVKADKNGDLADSKLFTWPSMYYKGVVVKPSLQGGYWMSGYTDSLFNAGDDTATNYIARLDEHLDIVRRFFFNSKLPTNISSFYELPDGDIVFCGDIKDSTNPMHIKDGFMARVDSMGQLIWWRAYREYPLLDNYLTCIRPAADGGFIACGSAGGFTVTPDAWVIRTDSNGCINASCTVQDGIRDFPDAIAISIFPNPAINEVSISLVQGVWREAATITVYDMSGRKATRVITSVNQQMVKLNVEKWPPGIYSIIIQGIGDTPVVRKLVVENR